MRSPAAQKLLDEIFGKPKAPEVSETPDAHQQARLRGLATKDRNKEKKDVLTRMRPVKLPEPEYKVHEAKPQALPPIKPLVFPDKPTPADEFHAALKRYETQQELVMQGYVTEADAARLLGITQLTLAKWRKAGYLKYAVLQRNKKYAKPAGWRNEEFRGVLRAIRGAPPILYAKETVEELNQFLMPIAPYIRSVLAQRRLWEWKARVEGKIKGDNNDK